jgi:cell division protein FtsQ
MSGVRFALRRPVLRRRVPVRGLAIFLALAAVGAGAWLWIRDAGTFAVREVVVTGATSSEQPRVQAALRSAARGMTTLHVDEQALRAAVAPYASVARIRVDVDFPRRLTINVVERAPIAVAILGDQRIPVTADGRLLRGVRASGELPTVTLRRSSATTRIGEARARASLAILAAAPEPLRARILRTRYTARGLTLDLSDGPQLLFGNQARLKAKWAAAARVLSDSRAAGAMYLDVRVPERVGAGGVGSVDPTRAEGSGTSTASDPAAAGAVAGDPNATPTIVAPSP